MRLTSPAPGLFLMLTLASGASSAATAESIAAGRAAFAACASCHEVGPSARHGFGPQLNQLRGRKAGSLSGYAYSEAMKQSGLVWDTATLTALIKSPSGTVPGTKMRFLGFGYNERKVADLLAYLESAQGPAAPPQAQQR